MLVCLLTVSVGIARPNQQLPKEGTGPWVVDVYFDNQQQLQRYANKNEPWAVNREKNYFTVSVENLHQYQELFSYGFRVEVNNKMMASSQIIKKAIAENKIEDTKSIPGFACYRTVEETFATMDTLETNYPNLATVIDIGDTWEKATPGGNAGYDMRVLKITNSAISGPKPILYINSSIHARELTPAELNTRFAEYLLTNYGTDAEATWLVDHREIHLLLQGNPDGRKIAETGIYKRKTQNNNHCPGSDNRGIDMNRNFGWMWNQGSGSSGVACDQTYRGPSAQSENENTAIDSYLKTLFIDARGSNLADAAPDDTTGVFIDIHSYSELVLWPYGFDAPNAIPLAPNHNQLRTLGRKFAWYNDYYPQASNQLYGADGASDDNAYGQLGVAAYTFELGTEFFQNCSVFESTILPKNLKALIYAAKVADTPYITASGPDLENINLSSNSVAAGTNITVTAVANDQHFNSSNGVETTQNIAMVELFVDQLPWLTTSVPVLMTAVDGNFDEKIEDVVAEINTDGFLMGQHVLYIQSTDANGVTGVPYARYFSLIDPAQLGTLSGVVADALSNQPLNAVTVNLGTQQVQSNAQGQFSFNVVAGSYNLSASKQGYSDMSVNNVSVVAQQNSTQNLQLQPICASLDENVNSYATIAEAVNAGWSHGANSGVDDWNINQTGGVASSRSFSSQNVGSVSDKYLISPAINLTSSSTLEFWHAYDLENNYDGGVLEISVDSGNTWIDLGPNIGLGAYPDSLNGGSNQPLGNVMAWNGNQSMSKVEVDLSNFANQTASIRWRMGTDNTVSAGFWEIDDIKLLDPNACSGLDVIFISGFE